MKVQQQQMKDLIDRLALLRAALHHLHQLQQMKDLIDQLVPAPSSSLLHQQLAYPGSSEEQCQLID